MKLTDAEREQLACQLGRMLAPHIEQIIAARLEQQREALAAAIEKGYLGADFGRSYDGQESPDARLHHAYDEGLEEAARIVREYQPGDGT